MSVKSWKRKYYPIPASRCNKKNAAAHTYQKWQGTLPSALKKHGLIKEGENTLVDADGKDFSFGTETCALCRQHWDPSECCPSCPVKRLSGRCCVELNAEYRHWLGTGDPKPMLAILRKAASEEPKP